MNNAWAYCRAVSNAIKAKKSCQRLYADASMIINEKQILNRRGDLITGSFFPAPLSWHTFLFETTMPSTVVKFVEYDPGSMEMKVGYVSGVCYIYKNVPEDVYLQLKTSRVKGIFLNKNIKGNYEYEKMQVSRS